MRHNWKDILVAPSSTIQDVLKVIDLGCFQLAIVTDESGCLLGTVTDGDIRRALIAKKSLDTPVSNIMFTEPTVGQVNTSREKLLLLMHEFELSAIPLLDEGRVVGLETLHQILQQKKYDNPVCLMAGGFGTRLKPLTNNCPKPLLKVGDRPILETVLLSFINSGFQRFYISTHYFPEMIREYFGDGSKWGVLIEYVHENEPLGTAGALGLLPKDLPDLPIIVMNGDILTKVDIEGLLDFHYVNNANATMCVREYEIKIPYGVVESEGNSIINMVEKPTQRFHINAGIYVIGKEIIDSVAKNEYIDMPCLLKRHLNNRVLLYPFHEYWLDIGQQDDFKRAQLDIKNLGYI